MKVFIRGHADPVDSDIPFVPPSTFGATSIARGDTTAGTQGPSGNSAPDLGITRADAVASSADSAHTGASAQYVPVASAIADLSQPTVAHGDMAEASSTGGGEIARGSDLASLDSGSSSYADYGWFVVPSADNEYGPAVYAAADDFGWSTAAGEFSADWFVA